MLINEDCYFLVDENVNSDAYSEPCQTSKMERFANVVIT